MSRLSQKIMEKKTNKAKLEIFKFLENRLNRKAIAFDEISRNCAFYGKSINIHLLGYFCMQNSYLHENSAKNTVFMKTQK